MRRMLPILIAPLALILAACGSSSSSSKSTSSASSAAPSPIRLATRTLPGLGSVVVTAQGRTLYVFEPDKAKKVTCIGQCARVWPPLLIAAGRKAGVSGQLNSSLVSSDPDPSGGQVITYASWPLYLFRGDRAPGAARGQALNINGGLWYVISPSGKVITTKPGGAAKP